MSVRRLAPPEQQPKDFAFNAENLAWAKTQIAKYPEGRQQSAVIPLLWRAQEQHGGWLPEVAIRYVADHLGMPHIRALEIATFYTQFVLQPAGKKAHIQVCGTTPCRCAAPKTYSISASIVSITISFTCRRTATSPGKRSNASAPA